MDENPRGKSSHVIWNENGFLVAKKDMLRFSLLYVASPHSLNCFSFS